MNVLIVGSGGREHAFAVKIKKSSLCGELYVAPGNAGTATIAENVPIGVDDFPALAKCCLEKNIDLLVVGPEVPLVAGIRDYFESDAALSQIKIVGPGKAGALLEGSKDFSKAFMRRHHIPTAGAVTFRDDQAQEAYQYIDTCQVPLVVKADGLAAGKGVIIAQSLEEAKSAVHEILAEKKFGEAGCQVLIEEFLTGIELSVFVLTDGKHYVILPEAKDYKRIGEKDTGLNTGGMGAISPVPFATEAYMKKVEDLVVRPTVEGLEKDNIDYRGFLFIGLMDVKGEPVVIEYNVRMGDPETQSVLSRLDNDLLELLSATATGDLHKQTIRHASHTSVTIVMTAAGYPEQYQKGDEITGLEKVQRANVFHAGTSLAEGKTVTSGGRVLAVTGSGDDLESARALAYEEISLIQWKGAYCRKDIGLDLLSFGLDDN